ncbi:MAG: hypothetical protein KJ556_20235 [Gammaproteobacteria bacterium]|nr:hypothetical protein [Gammaproteobacteria bacterium]
MEKYIIIKGNVVDGLEFIGPFDSAEEANNHADYYLDPQCEWVIGELKLKS